MFFVFVSEGLPLPCLCPLPFMPLVCLLTKASSMYWSAFNDHFHADNSPWAGGIFYEGVMTTGFSSSGTDAAVMTNIVAAGYA